MKVYLTVWGLGSGQVNVYLDCEVKSSGLPGVRVCEVKVYLEFAFEGLT